MYLPQNIPKKKKQTSKASLYSDSNDAKKIGALHKRLTNEWQLHGPDTKRILLDKNKTQSNKKNEAFISIDLLDDDDKATALQKGAHKLLTLSHHEQMHRLQNALRDRIMIHKSNDDIQVISKDQMKSVRNLMEYLNTEMEKPSQSASLKKRAIAAAAPQRPIKSFVELYPSHLVKVADRFYKDQIFSRTIGDKMLSNKPGEQSTSSNARHRQKTKRNAIVDKFFKDGTDIISEDFSDIFRENETDCYFMLGLPSYPSVKQLLSNFRDIHRSSLKSEQELYHLFRLSILSNKLKEGSYSSKYLL